MSRQRLSGRPSPERVELGRGVSPRTTAKLAGNKSAAYFGQPAQVQRGFIIGRPLEQGGDVSIHAARGTQRQTASTAAGSKWPSRHKGRFSAAMSPYTLLRRVRAWA